MSYRKRGKHSPFESYMSGVCGWMSPRQIIIFRTILEKVKDNFKDDINKEAMLDFKDLLDYEYEVKSKRYPEETKNTEEGVCQLLETMGL